MVWTPSFFLETDKFLSINSFINDTLFLPLAGEEVVFIANDWHTALLPCYLKSMYKPKGMYKTAKVRCPCFEVHHMELWLT